MKIKFNYLLYVIVFMILFVINIDSVDAVGNCVNSIGWLSDCPCTDKPYKEGEMYDPDFKEARVLYRDDTVGQDKDVSLDEWLKVSKQGDTAVATFYYGSESEYTLKTGESRYETVEIKRKTSGTDGVKERGFKCISSTSRGSIPISTDDKDEEDYLDNFRNYSCKLLQDTETYKKFLKPAYAILKIAAPGLVVLLCSIDIASAVIAEDADKMNKAKRKIVRRIIIGVCLFLLPTLIDAILELAGLATSTCGIR